jgi:Skp family chaperone for outer membrane proteins
MKVHNLGWGLAGVMALAMAGMVGAGMQTPSMKIGVVDWQRVFNESEHAKKQEDIFRGYQKRREDALRFFESYKTMDTKVLLKFRELSVKDSLQPAEKAELEKIKLDAIAADKKYRELQTKNPPNAEELKQLEELNGRVRTAQNLLLNWAQGFDEELRQMQGKMRVETLTKVRKAVKEVGAKEGYTVVYVNDVAPYGANDLTEATLKAVNAQR